MNRFHPARLMSLLVTIYWSEIRSRDSDMNRQRFNRTSLIPNDPENEATIGPERNHKPTPFGVVVHRM